MFGGMMDPEMIRLAQEQMSRIPPDQLAKMQQQIMSNPDLMRVATESMRNVRPEDMRRAAEQLKHTRPEDMAEISEKISKAKPEELAAMQAQVDAHVSYQLNAAQMLKKEGNELHNHGRFHEAAKKYLLAKNNLTGIPDSRCKTLQLQCTLNLMSCYLKTRQFEECIREGSEVLENDSDNVKALYRRGQAYKEAGNLSAAVADLSKAHRVSPDDETIADVLREAKEKMMQEGGNTTPGVVIEEIVENDDRTLPLESEQAAKYSVTQPAEAGENSQNTHETDYVASADKDSLKGLKDNPEALRMFKNYFSTVDPELLAASSGGGMSSDMIKMASAMIKDMDPKELQEMLEVASALDNKAKGPSTSLSTENSGQNGPSIGPSFPAMTPEMVKMASDKISKMSPEELQSMFHVASSTSGEGPSGNGASLGSKFPEMTPEMVKLASDRIGNMSSEELQNMLKVGSSMNSTSSEATFQPPVAASSSTNTDAEEKNQPSSIFPGSTDLQENMRNSMRDPAMRQMFSSMMKNMSPEMMANMSEQFGVKMSKEDATKAQQVMSSLSPEDLDRMMKWADRAQRGVETVKKTKNWLLGRPGLILAVVMLLIAFVLHQLGFIGG